MINLWTLSRATILALATLLSAPPALAEWLSPTHSKLAAQYALIWLGHYDGLLDADYGPRTTAAIAAFQRTQGWVDTGVLSPDQSPKLSTLAEEQVRAFDYKLINDPHAGFELGLPAKLLVRQEKLRSGIQYVLTGKVFIRTEKHPTSNRSLEEHYAKFLETRSEAPLRVNLPPVNGRFFVSGADKDYTFYFTGRETENEIISLSIRYPQIYKTFDRVMVAMVNSFHYPGSLLPFEGVNELSSTDRVIAAKILQCYNSHYASTKKLLTIRGMRDCSGVWVSPRALMLCAMGTQCPYLQDLQSATFDTVLVSEGFTKDHELILRVADLPKPDLGKVAACKGSAKSEKEFLECTVNATISPKVANLRSCLEKVASNSNNQANCLMGEAKNRDLVAAGSAFACVQSVSAPGDAYRCVTSGLGEGNKIVAECMAVTQNSEAAAACLDRISPESAAARKIVACLSDTSKTKATCAAGIGGDATRIANCIRDDDRKQVALCLLGDKPEVRNAQKIYECVVGSNDPSKLIANCTNGILDDKSRKTIACIGESSNKAANLAACAAGAILPPEAARIVGCASSGRGATSVALCIAAPSMNEESRIAADCAINTGGQPYAAAACTLTALTIRELENCFNGKGCFGPNNTIVVALRNAFKDLTEGPSDSNEIVKVVREISRILDEARRELEPRTRITIDKDTGCHLARNVTLGLFRGNC